MDILVSGEADAFLGAVEEDIADGGVGSEADVELGEDVAAEGPCDAGGVGEVGERPFDGDGVVVGDRWIEVDEGEGPRGGVVIGDGAVEGDGSDEAGLGGGVGCVELPLLIDDPGGGGCGGGGREDSERGGGCGDVHVGSLSNRLGLVGFESIRYSVDGGGANKMDGLSMGNCWLVGGIACFIGDRVL